MIFKRVIFGSILWVGLAFSSSGQSNSIQLELLGNGILYSLNYEHVHPLSSNAISFRIGASYTPFDGSNFLTIPVSVNYILGSRPHKLEFGAGGTYYDGKIYIVGDYEYDSSFGFYANVMYRYDHPEKRHIVRAGLNPLVTNELTTALWFGVGYGLKIGKL
jgi:hypothetical protein